MKTTILLLSLFISITENSAYAVSLNNNEWLPSACGEKPNPPSVDDQNVDGFNKSVQAINDWQQQAKTYYGCLVAEANKDNTVIADKANREQAVYNKVFETLTVAVDAAKKKLDKK